MGGGIVVTIAAALTTATKPVTATGMPHVITDVTIGAIDPDV